MAIIKLVGPTFNLDPDNPCHIDTTSRSKNWSRGLSPFLIGPCKLYASESALNMENAWQYSKVYSKFIDAQGEPTTEYFNWARKGWLTQRAIRYPMGKGAKPAYSYWDGNKLGYIEARRQIYIPLYSSAVKDTEAFNTLTNIYNKYDHMILKDFDAYDVDTSGAWCEDVIENPHKKMGHAFVLVMMLQKVC